MAFSRRMFIASWGGYVGYFLGAMGGALAGPVGAIAGGAGGATAGVAIAKALLGEDDREDAREDDPENSPQPLERESLFSPQKLTITNKESATLGRNSEDGYQLKFEVGSLPPGVEKVELTVNCEIGSYQIQAVPKGEAVVSGFYSLEISTLTPLEKDATFTIQHCSRGANPNHIRVIRAKSGKRNNSYIYVDKNRVEVKGSVVVVKLRELASYVYAVVCDWASSWMSISYCGILYRLEKERELADSFYFHFVVIRDLSLHITAVEKVYKEADRWRHVSREIEPMPLAFAPVSAGSKRKVALAITRDGITTENGWMIKAKTLPAEVWEEDVKKYNPEKLSIPMFELNASSTNAIPERLETYVDLNGSTKQKQILLQYTPGPRGYMKRNHKNGPKMEDLRLEFDKGVCYIAEKIGSKYLEVGTFLLDDVDGSKMADLMDETKRDPYWISYNIFMKYVNGEGREPVTWEYFAQILRHCHLIELAEQIKICFNAGEQPDISLSSWTNAQGMDQSLRPNNMEKKPIMPSILCFGRNKIDIRERIGDSWREFGTFILKDDCGSKMNNLQEKYRNDAAEKINHEIFSRWLRGEGKRCSWKKLIQVLKMMKMKTLADEINNEFVKKSEICTLS